MGAQQIIWVLMDAIQQAHLAQYRCCSVNIVVGFAENIIATVTDSAQLEKNNDSDCGPAAGP